MAHTKLSCQLPPRLDQKGSDVRRPLRHDLGCALKNVLPHSQLFWKSPSKKWLDRIFTLFEYFYGSLARSTRRISTSAVSLVRQMFFVLQVDLWYVHRGRRFCECWSNLSRDNEYAKLSACGIGRSRDWSINMPGFKQGVFWFHRSINTAIGSIVCANINSISQWRSDLQEDSCCKLGWHKSPICGFDIRSFISFGPKRVSMIFWELALYWWSQGWSLF